MKPSRISFKLLAVATMAALLAACGGGGGNSGGGNPPTSSPTTPTPPPAEGTPIPLVTATPGAQPTMEANFQCPSSNTQSTVAVGRAGGGSASVGRHAVQRGMRPLLMNAIAVEYDTTTLNAQRKSVASRVASFQTSVAREFTFTHTGRSVQVIHLQPSQIASAIQTFERMPGVRSVTQMTRRRALANRYFTNDPYFTGFNGSPSTFEQPPYEETASIPGQWDMHVMGLEYAYGIRSQVEGSPNVRLAIIDTGEDLTSPELDGVGKVAGEGCFITDPTNFQSTGPFETDPQGHGTDVAGIAVDDTNNDIGYAGAGGNTSLVAYRVFPFPDTSCDNDNPNGDSTCGADPADIASAIEDAIHHQQAKVISMSLGATGADVEPESGAVADAIAANIVVVAAAGNDNNGATAGYTPGGSTTTSLDSPGNDPGVIAAGATSLDDGQPNGWGSGGNAGGTATVPVEYVADYSDYASNNTANSASAWGIVAPGGDSAGTGDNDNFHWIQNIWTSMPADPTYSWDGNGDPCTGDYPTGTGTADCYTEIDGTSMATPHVAGVAAMIIAANSAYASPTAMKTLLCQTADPVSTAEPGQGCGRIDVYRALSVALGRSDPGAPTSPY